MKRNKPIDDICLIIQKSLNNKKFNLHEPIIGKNEKKYVNKCLNSGFVSSAGKMIEEFESKIIKITKSKYAISVANGTEAIKISLIAAGVKYGDEVLVPSLTFVGSVSPIKHIGATPHFIDSDFKNFGVNFEKLKKYLKINTFKKNKNTFNKKTGKIIKAIIPVHIFGHPCEIEKIVKLCKKYNIVTIEDAAEGLGSFYKNKHVGNFGLIGCISFNGNKIITTGAGGIILTNNRKIAFKLRHLITTAKVSHAFEYIHDDIGYNLRMSNLNAALGLGQIENFRKFLYSKRKLYNHYFKFFKSCGYFEFFKEPQHAQSNYWLQTIILKEKFKHNKNNIIKNLQKKGIGARPAWKLISTLKPYQDCPRMSLNIAKKIYAKVINLPSGPSVMMNLKK
tara:strand:- start:9235 stop:10413 length:1179 start_codon:yes stop_codon:yes gene_type:complete